MGCLERYFVCYHRLNSLSECSNRKKIKINPLRFVSGVVKSLEIELHACYI